MTSIMWDGVSSYVANILYNYNIYGRGLEVQRLQGQEAGGERRVHAPVE